MQHSNSQRGGDGIIFYQTTLNVEKERLELERELLGIERQRFVKEQQRPGISCTEGNYFDYSASATSLLLLR